MHSQAKPAVNVAHQAVSMGSHPFQTACCLKAAKQERALGESMGAVTSWACTRSKPLHIWVCACTAT